MAAGDEERRTAARQANRADRRLKRLRARDQRKIGKVERRSEAIAERDGRGDKKKGTNYPEKATSTESTKAPPPPKTAEDVSAEVAASASQKKGETYGATAAQTKAKEEPKPKPQVTKPVRPKRTDFEDDKSFNRARAEWSKAWKAWRAAGSPGAAKKPKQEGEDK